MGFINGLIPHILQNILFYVQQKKKTHTGLEQHEGMEARFRHWKKKVIATFYLTILTFFLTIASLIL